MDATDTTTVKMCPECGHPARGHFRYGCTSKPARPETVSDTRAPLVCWCRRNREQAEEGSDMTQATTCPCPRLDIEIETDHGPIVFSLNEGTRYRMTAVDSTGKRNRGPYVYSEGVVRPCPR